MTRIGRAHGKAYAGIEEAAARGELNTRRSHSCLWAPRQTLVTMNTVPLDLPLAFEFDEESVHAQTAKMLGLKAVHSQVDLIERLEKGLKISTVHSLRVRANLTDAETYQLIAPRRTLNRRERSGQLLSTEEADKAVRVCARHRPRPTGIRWRTRVCRGLAARAQILVGRSHAVAIACHRIRGPRCRGAVSRHPTRHVCLMSGLAINVRGSRFL